MSKFLILLVLIFNSNFTLAGEDIGEMLEIADWKGYSQCQKMVPLDKDGNPHKKQIQNKKTKAELIKCNDNMKNLEGFVKSDGEIFVDPKSLIEEIQSMVQEHVNQIADNEQLYSKFKATCVGLMEEYPTRNNLEILKIKIDNGFGGVSSSTPVGLGMSFDQETIEATSINWERSKASLLDKTKMFQTQAQNNSQVGRTIGTDQSEYIIPKMVAGRFKKLDSIVPLCNDTTGGATNKYTSGKVTLDRSGELSFIEPSDDYYGRLCEHTVQEACYGDPTTVEECQQKIGSATTFSELFGGKENTAILGEESVKMIGHCYEKKKLEHYVAVTRNQGHFDESEKYFSGEAKVGQRRTECQRANRYTVDYKACVGIVGAQNAVVIGDVASKSVGAVTNSLHQNSIQRGYQQDLQAGESAQEAALEAQKRTYVGQRNIATGASATYGASAAGLSTMLTAYPSQGSFSRKCKDLEIGEKHSANKGINYCYLIQSIQADNQLKGMFANQNIKEGAWGIVGQLGAESLKHALEAAHFNDMYKQTSGMQNDLNKALEEVATIGFDSCQANPELCDQNGTPGETSTFEMGNFNMGNNGSTDLAYTKPPESIGDTDSGATVSKTVANKLSDSLSETGENFSDDFKKIGAGDLGKASSGGPSGGGSAGGGGGGSVAGGSDTPAGSADAGTSSGFAGVRAKWNGKGGSVGYRKGGGTTKKKANPYGSLFDNKKGSRNIASEVNDIAAKESGLFKKISNRYEKLNSANRLKKF